MFTTFGFSESEKARFQDVARHLGPQLEDLVNLAIYDFPEKYRNDITEHMKDPSYKQALKHIILEAYHELKGSETLLDKWQIYNRALHKVKKYFIHTLKLDVATKDLRAKGFPENDIY